MQKKSLIVKCPSCKSTFNYYDSKFRPFCSDRCQKIDLGHWLSETYVVPTKESAVELEETNKVLDEDEPNDSDYE